MRANLARRFRLLLLGVAGILVSTGLATAEADEGFRGPGEQDRWPFQEGRIEVGLQAGGGVALQHDPRSGSMFTLLPRAGYVLHEFKDILPGSVEILAQPTYLTVFQRNTAHVFGLAALAKYNVRTGTDFTPFVEAGAGVSYATLPVPHFGSRFNFILQAGVGLQYAITERYALSFEWLYQHLSNADIYPSNPGLNASLFLLGFSVFLP